MKIQPHLILTILLFVPTFAFAAWINKQGETLSDSESRQARGEFMAQVILVGDESELFRRWAIPSETVDIQTIDTVVINGFINAFVVFRGCNPDAKGYCNVSMRFRVIQPDGKVYADTPPMEVWENKPAPQGKTLELSVQYLKIRIEPKDQLGRYVIYTQVRDNNTGTILQMQSPFTALKERK